MTITTTSVFTIDFNGVKVTLDREGVRRLRKACDELIGPECRSPFTGGIGGLNPWYPQPWHGTPKSSSGGSQS